MSTTFPTKCMVCFNRNGLVAWTHVADDCEASYARISCMNEFALVPMRGGGKGLENGSTGDSVSVTNGRWATAPAYMLNINPGDIVMIRYVDKDKKLLPASYSPDAANPFPDPAPRLKLKRPPLGEFEDLHRRMREQAQGMQRDADQMMNDADKRMAQMMRDVDKGTDSAMNTAQQLLDRLNIPVLFSDATRDARTSRAPACMQPPAPARPGFCARLALRFHKAVAKPKTPAVAAEPQAPVSAPIDPDTERKGDII